VPRARAHAREPGALGVWVIVACAVLSALALAAFPARKPEGRTVWTFARPHADMYAPIVERWNADRSPRITMSVLSLPALERRMMSGFLSRTPVADLIEAERQIASRAFQGPLDAVGFADLTDLLANDGLTDQIVPAAFSPWTSRGRIFGLPHDVHPVMLGYRADLVEAAGIDVSKIETWEDFFRTLRPLMADADKDGQPDRYLLNIWPTAMNLIELLMLQAGGTLFDEQDQPTMDAERNAFVLATIVSWCVGPNRVAADAPDFSASGNKLKVDGYVVANLMPDWMCNIYRREMPQLSGKMKLMPLPAWEKGGRRTSVWGGTMLGIPRDAAGREELWAFAKHLYFSPELARTLYEVGEIVTPVKANWNDPIFDQPDAFYGGQPKGRMYINLAGDVPRRTSSPYNVMALDRLRDAAVRLKRFADEEKAHTVEALLPRARELLGEAQRAVKQQMDRNVFWKAGDAGVPGAGAGGER
jgi:arabinosaccharide transport system substrate-binding protein